ncbi:MAG: penicillin-binding transpeptidase domain-containing protein, partial [Planctomycetota bacterium]|nr:penicillin-binding transpeptidase domain-containing protein [Planctomycetota bacterium]
MLVLLGLGFAAVGGGAVRLSLAQAEAPASRAVTVEDPALPVVLLDRSGRPLAASVQVYDLQVSPRDLWRAHTPWRVTELLFQELAGVLSADWGEEQLLLRLLPATAGEEEPGWLLASGAALTDLSPRQAADLAAWADRHDLPGLFVDPAGGPDSLMWCPSLLLDESVRLEVLGAAGEGHPERWTAWLLREMGLVLGHLTQDSGSVELRLQALPPALASMGEGLVRDARVLAYADHLWDELLPSRFRVVVKELDREVAGRVRDLLVREGVSPWQLRLEQRTARLHLVSEEGRSNLSLGSAQAIPGIEDKAFEILGHWGTLSAREAWGRARWERDYEPWRLSLAGAGDPVAQRAHELMNQPDPGSGLELLVQRELEAAGCVPRVRGSSRTWERVVLPRDLRLAVRAARLAARGRVEQARVDGVTPDPLDLGLAEGRFDGYLEGRLAERPHEVRTTLDHDLQLRLEELLPEVVDAYQAAGAMALVVEVETGDVLAIADHSGYALSGFMPAQYLFTPGSIMKPLIMAIAFDAGVVSEDDRFQSNGMEGIRVPGRPKLVREAKGAQPGWHSPAYGLAHSQNAVLVQIGMRIPARRLHDRLTALGLGPATDLGIGPIRDGVLLPVEQWDGASRGEPVPGLTPASLSFGHAIQVNALQMGEALLTLLRGGERVPLRFVMAVDGEEQPVRPRGRVLEAAACERIEDYMRLGAASTDSAFEGTEYHMKPGHRYWPESGHWRGTGAEIAKQWFLGMGVESFGSKTGTTEKEAGVPCSHADAEHWLRHEADGTRCSSACRRELKERGAPHAGPC